jgi:hypothetical protein
MLLVNIATIVLCFGVGGGLVVSLWRSCRGKPVVRTNTEHPRDILLLIDGTWCFRGECDPELMLRDSDYHVVKRTSFEWHIRARHLPDEHLRITPYAAARPNAAGYSIRPMASAFTLSDAPHE